MLVPKGVHFREVPLYVHFACSTYRKVLVAVVVELCLFHCRYTQPTTGMEVKVDLQLYQIDHKNYLLDFKCVSPSEAELSTPSSTERHYTMEFFEMCARIISSLAQ